MATTMMMKESQSSDQPATPAQWIYKPSGPEYKIPEFEMTSVETKESDIARMKKSYVHITNRCYQENKRPHPKMMPFMIPIPNIGARGIIANSNEEDGIVIYPVEFEINLEITWHGMLMAAKTIAHITPQSVMVASDHGDGSSYALTEFASHMQARLFNGGSYDFIRKNPSLLIITHPTKRDDHRRLMKNAYLAGIPTIAFCPYDCPTEYVDDVNTTVIPAYVSLTSYHAVPCLFNILCRMVLQARGQMKQGPGWYKMCTTLLDLDTLLPVCTHHMAMDDDDEEEEEEEEEDDISYDEYAEYVQFDKA
ncbi:hypothetical protein OROMI_000505 [Orobanche minor]